MRLDQVIIFYSGLVSTSVLFNISLVLRYPNQSAKCFRIRTLYRKRLYSCLFSCFQWLLIHSSSRFQANQAKKTLYVKSQQLPKLNGKPVFLAINPLNALAPVNRGLPQQPVLGDQVAILVRLQKAPPTTKPVLLNVPRKVALKVKVGTTLSFSASNDHKYIVMDSKIHPPVGTVTNNRRPAPPPSNNKPRLPLPPSLTVIPNSGRAPLARRGQPQPVNRSIGNILSNKRPGLTITRGPSGVGPMRPAKVARPLPVGSSVLASGEV